jgi:hypothetical protein
MLDVCYKKRKLFWPGIPHVWPDYFLNIRMFRDVQSFFKAWDLPEVQNFSKRSQLELQGLHSFDSFFNSLDRFCKGKPDVAFAGISESDPRGCNDSGFFEQEFCKTY